MKNKFKDAFSYYTISRIRNILYRFSTMVEENGIKNWELNLIMSDWK